MEQRKMEKKEIWKAGIWGTVTWKWGFEKTTVTTYVGPIIWNMRDS
jgi:hypothetical protein